MKPQKVKVVREWIVEVDLDEMEPNVTEEETLYRDVARTVEELASLAIARYETVVSDTTTVTAVNDGTGSL